MLKKINWTSLLICIAIPVILGTLSGFASVDSISGWYSTLKKPPFNPPNYLFGPVWTFLYTLMGVSLYIVLQTPKTDLRNTALLIFVTQLLLNLSWSLIFFNAQSPFAAFLMIIAMWIAILAMIIYFHKISPSAAYLQVPYLLWVSFASVLNGAIWYLNR